MNSVLILKDRMAVWEEVGLKWIGILPPWWCQCLGDMTAGITQHHKRISHLIMLARKKTKIWNLVPTKYESHSYHGKALSLYIIYIYIFIYYIYKIRWTILSQESSVIWNYILQICINVKRTVIFIICILTFHECTSFHEYSSTYLCLLPFPWVILYSFLVEVS